jgi:hypothetical protein
MNYLRSKLSFALFFMLVYIYLNSDLGALFSLNFGDRQLDTLRSQIYSCFAQNVDIFSIILGGYESNSGKCAMDIIGVKYLHSLYLEAFTHLGLVGYSLVLVSLWSLYIVWRKKKYQLLTVFFCIGMYGLVESVGVWSLFYIALYSFGVQLGLQQVNMRKYILRKQSPYV